MRAARYYGQEDIRVESIPEPKCKEDSIKLAPAFVGICGTDLHEYLGGPTICPTDIHPLTHEGLPLVLGHELSGTITAVGSSVKDFAVGDRIVVHPSLYDYTCGACLAGSENVCYNGGFIGLSGGGGGLADFLTIPADHAHHLPDNISLEIGALVEPLAVAWHALGLSPLQKDSNILVLGGGPIGIAIILCLRAQGCGKIVVSELSAQRSKFAKRFGADYVLDPTKEVDYVGRVKELTGGEGPDIVFDCAGVASALESACQSLKVCMFSLLSIIS
jgi:threonine dehydrogenase-like Zn-dependent dehydrogenase